METEKLVYSLIKEAIEIAMQDIDIAKSTDESGQMLRYGIQLKPNKYLFHIKNADGTSFPNPRILEIGLSIHRIGGLKLMQQSYYEIIRPFGAHGPGLKWAWNNVGDWRG